MGSFAFVTAMLAVGGLVGVLSAALGIGGGVLMVPAFVHFVDGMDINTAKGTSLFVITLVAAVNSWRMNRGEMRSPWPLVIRIAIGAIVGGYLGAWVTTLMSDRAVSWLVIAFLAFAAVRTYLLHPPTVSENEVKSHDILAMGIGLATGIVSGATGTGGGAILVPLTLWAGIVSNERVVALSNTVMVATCAAGTLAHAMASPLMDTPWTYGLVNVSMVPLVFAAAVLCAPLGRIVNRKLNFRARAIIMSAMLFLIAARLIYRALA